MKKILSEVIISFLILLLNIHHLNCSSSENSSNVNTDGTKFVVGKILMVENEPFSKLALLTDSSVYLLDYQDTMKEIIYKNQGNRVKVFYDTMAKNQDSVKVIKVNRIEFLNEHLNDQ